MTAPTAHSLCPQCGCPPREIEGKAVVRAFFTREGKITISRLISFDSTAKLFCGG